MRSCELAAFTQVMRTHEGINPKVNAQFDSDPTMLAHFARMSRIHQALLPYHMQVSEQYQALGLPPIRPVLIKDNRVAAGQFFYGDDLLVAPILKKHAHKRKVWLSEGRWVHFFSGKEYGEGSHTVSSEIGYPPVFIRSTSNYKALCRKIAQKERK